MDVIFCAPLLGCYPDLHSSSDSSSQEGAYLNEMEGPSLPGANSVTCSPSPATNYSPRGDELEIAYRVLRVGRMLGDERYGEPNGRERRLGEIGSRGWEISDGVA
jgi:hypothetical protein